MKKILVLCIVMMVAMVSAACAEPKALPAGAIVSATCNGDGTASVMVVGVPVESFEKYNYFYPKEVVSGAGPYVIKLDEGRRFNFTFANGFYAGLAKEMAKKYGYAPNFLGQNIDVDSSNENGACFIVTCPAAAARR